jgi:hypothetical protein
MKTEIINAMKYQYIENTLLGSKLIETEATEGKVEVEPLRGESRHVKTSLEILENARREPVTMYDSIVASACYTLYEHGEDKFSANKLHEIMTGGGKRPTPAQLEDIRTSIRKMMGMRVRIDITDEMRARKGRSGKAVLETYLMPVEILDETYGNQETTIYHLLQCPPLCEYAKCINQVISYDPDQLSWDDLKQTRDTLQIRYIVLRKVMMAYNSKSTKSSADVTFGEIYKALGYNEKELSRKSKRRIVENTMQIVDGYVQHSDSPVYDYEPSTGKRGKTVGVRIGVAPKHQQQAQAIPDSEECEVQGPSEKKLSEMSPIEIADMASGFKN